MTRHRWNRVKGHSVARGARRQTSGPGVLASRIGCDVSVFQRPGPLSRCVFRSTGLFLATVCLEELPAPAAAAGPESAVALVPRSPSLKPPARGGHHRGLGRGDAGTTHLAPSASRVASPHSAYAASPGPTHGRRKGGDRPWSRVRARGGVPRVPGYRALRPLVPPMR